MHEAVPIEELSKRVESLEAESLRVVARLLSLEENKAIVRRLIEEMWNQGKLEVIDEVFPPSGIEGAKQIVTTFRTAFPDLHFTIEDQIAEGDKVTTRYTLTGTHTGEFMGIPPTGKQVTVTGMSISRIVDSKLVEEWDNVDTLGMMQQLGVIPPIGQGEE